MNIIIYVDQQEKKSNLALSLLQDISVWSEQHAPPQAFTQLCTHLFHCMDTLPQTSTMLTSHSRAGNISMLLALYCYQHCFLISIPTWYRYSSSATKWQINNHYSLWSLKGNMYTVKNRVFCSLWVFTVLRNQEEYKPCKATAACKRTLS